jgi:predicted outer membrane repeat protein
MSTVSHISPSTGSDANDCSRHAPCLTLQRALNQTVAHGSVTVLDSGNLGIAATIAKAVTVTAPAGIHAWLERAASTLLTVNAPSDAIVTINGLSLDGRGTAQSGISYTSGGALYLNRVSISNFNLSYSVGLYAATNTAGVHLKVVVEDSFISGTEYGISGSAAATGASSRVLLDNSRLRGNTTGVILNLGARANISHSLVSGNGLGYGVYAQSGSIAWIVDSMFSDNDVGLYDNGGAIYASRCVITANNTGVLGPVYTGGDNMLIGNTTNGSLAAPIPLK